MCDVRQLNYDLHEILIIVYLYMYTVNYINLSYCAFHTIDLFDCTRLRLVHEMMEHITSSTQLVYYYRLPCHTRVKLSSGAVIEKVGRVLITWTFDKSNRNYIRGYGNRFWVHFPTRLYLYKPDKISVFLAKVSQICY